MNDGPRSVEPARGMREGRARDLSIAAQRSVKAPEGEERTPLRSSNTESLAISTTLYGYPRSMESIALIVYTLYFVLLRVAQ